MSKVLSLKLRDDVFQEIENIIHQLKIPRNTYINEALAFYNRQNRRKILQKQLARESELVQHNSLEVLADFEKLED